MTSKIIVNNIEPDAGISTVTFNGNIQGNSIKATTITGVSTAGITTAYIGSINDGPISGARNRIINGDMRIDQRNNGASVTTSVLQVLTYTVDRWGYYNDVVSKRTIQRSGVVPVGFTSSLAVTIIATDTVGPQQFILQSVEGYNIIGFDWGTSNAKPVTLSFWVRSSVTGQHGGSIQNSTITRSFPFAYTINSANTWEYKTIVISGETSGTWLYDNNIGLRLVFEHGPGYQTASAGSWVTTNTTTSTGSVNLCATNGATWYITGVQLEVGSVATPFERRSYGQELALCQRYFEIVNINGVTTFYDSFNVQHRGTLFWKVTKRADPTTNTSFVSNYQPGGGTGTASCSNHSVGGCLLTSGSTNSTWVNQWINSNSSIQVSAEL